MSLERWYQEVSGHQQFGRERIRLYFNGIHALGGERIAAE